MTFDPTKLSLEERQKLKENIADLRTKFDLFSRKDDLQVGDLVFWKQGLTNRRYPRPGTAGIVTRVFPVAVKDESKTEAGSPYFGEDLSACVGILDNDGDFVEFAYDAQRLQRIEPGTLLGKHVGFACDGCRSQDFAGVRFHCAECDNFDLCATCHDEGAQPGSHSRSHKMDTIEPCSEELLRDRLALFTQTACFQPGDLVQWKAGLQNKRLPRKDGMAVVVEMLPKPITDDDKGSSGSYFLEPLDMRLGLVDEDGDFVIFHYDSRRFTRAM